VVLVHARGAEEAFMAAGHGSRREDLMRNTFELLGPKGDPAEVKGLEIGAALARIATKGPLFVSRGDDSGTHKKELTLWRQAGGLKPWDRYIETGQGMGRSLIVADEKEAYILADRATYLAFRHKIELVPLVVNSEHLNNHYGVMVVSREQHPSVDEAHANAFVDYLLSADGQKIIRDFTVGGERLFFPARPSAEK